MAKFAFEYRCQHFTVRGDILLSSLTKKSVTQLSLNVSSRQKSALSRDIIRFLSKSHVPKSRCVGEERFAGL